MEKISKFKIGNLVSLKSDPEVKLPVLNITHGLQETVYTVFRNNQKKEYFESQLFFEDEIIKQTSNINSKVLKALISSYKILSPSLSNLFSLKSGNIEFVPYQYRPVLKLLSSDSYRLLIADEVGVGKTIETGLIIKELQARLNIESILVICPKPLVSEKKWYQEMKRFDLQFTAIDGPTLKHCISETNLEGDWPQNFQKCIIPYSLFDSDMLYGSSKKNKHKQLGLINLDPAPKFDLVVIDEAHNARNTDTYIHQAVKYFCDNASSVLLLTATPIQLGNNDLFTLLNLMRPDLIIDKQTFQKMAEPNVFINKAIKSCRENKKDWSKLAFDELKKCNKTEWGKFYLRNSPDYNSLFTELTTNNQTNENRLDIIRKLEDLYTFSKLINRTRRRDIGSFCLRKPKTISVNFTENQSKLHDSLLNIISRSLSKTYKNTNPKFMMTTIQRQASSCIYGLKPLLKNILNKKLNDLGFAEMFFDIDMPNDTTFEDIQDEIELILKETETLEEFDPKLEELKKFLKERETKFNNKTLLFSTFIHTLEYLFKNLTEIGFRVALIHGNIKENERFSIRKRFALPKENKDAFDIMLSSEVGCEGLDFQFCDLLINYDIPWNPMRIEQRIGRIDRYGQKSETVGILNFVTPGTIDADIYNRCLVRIGIFENSIGASEEILGSIAQEIKDIAENFILSEDDKVLKLQQLSDNTIRDIQEQKLLEKRDAELFGLNLPSENWKNQIEQAETFWLSPVSLQHTIETYLKKRLNMEGEIVSGIHYEKNLRLNKDNRDILYNDFKSLKKSNETSFKKWEKWLKGTQPNLKITFENKVVDPNKNITLVNVLHPLLKQAAEYIHTTSPVKVSIKIENESFPKGLHPFAIYSWNKVGFKNDWELVPISKSKFIEKNILSLLEKAKDNQKLSDLSELSINELEKIHYEKWNKERAKFQSYNEILLDQKKQSLSLSYKIRKTNLEKQINYHTNEKILTMRSSELKRCTQDYEDGIGELKNLSQKVDIHTTPLIFGTITSG